VFKSVHPTGAPAHLAARHQGRGTSSTPVDQPTRAQAGEARHGLRTHHRPVVSSQGVRSQRTSRPLASRPLGQQAYKPLGPEAQRPLSLSCHKPPGLEAPRPLSPSGPRLIPGQEPGAGRPQGQQAPEPKGHRPFKPLGPVTTEPESQRPRPLVTSAPAAILLRGFGIQLPQLHNTMNPW
jgi:hypothetical protein